MFDGLHALLDRAVNGADGVIGADWAPGGERPAIRPTFSHMTVSEAALMLQGLYLVNLQQLAHGAPPVSDALQRSRGGGRRLRYIRRDKAEHWRTIRDLWRFGGGDCEDLAAAVAAESTWRGQLARPVIYRVRPGLSHAVVEVLEGPLAGKMLDPSRTGGMGEA